MLIHVRASSQRSGTSLKTESETGERPACEARATLTPRFSDFFTDFKKKKPTVLQYITLVPAFAIKLVSFLPDVAERERERPSLKCFAVLYMICTVNPKRSSLSVYMIPQ